MTQEEARKAAQILLAYADGKEIESKDDEGKWTDEDPTDWETAVDKFRIKPTYRPFANAEECWEEMKKHEPFGWVKWKDDEGDEWYTLLTDITSNTVFVNDRDSDTFELALKDYTFADGTPFGKLIEE